MATKLEDEFDPTRINAPDAAYPAGSLKDETTPGVSDDGTPLAARVGNDWQGFSQSALDKAGIAANGQPDSVTNPQILQAIEQMYNDGDSQRAGGNIWPLSSQESAQVGDDLTGFEFVRLQGGNFSEITLFPVIKKDGTETPLSGAITNINLTSKPYDATVGSDDVWLLDIKYHDIESVNTKAFWATGGGIEDDRPQIKEAIDFANIVNLPVIHPEGNYKLLTETAGDAYRFRIKTSQIGINAEFSGNNAIGELIGNVFGTPQIELVEDIEISGFYFNNFQNAIRFNNTRSCKIKGNHFFNCTVQFASDDVLYPNNNNNNNTVELNYFQLYDYRSNPDYHPNPTPEEITEWGGTSFGLRFTSDPFNDAHTSDAGNRHNDIRNNRFDYAAYSGFEMAGPKNEHNIIEGNYFYRCSGTGCEIDKGGTGNAIKYNFFEDTVETELEGGVAQAHIQLQRAGVNVPHDNSLIGNRFLDNVGDDYPMIKLQGATETTIDDNKYIEGSPFNGEINIQSKIELLGFEGKINTLINDCNFSRLTLTRSDVSFPKLDVITLTNSTIEGIESFGNQNAFICERLFISNVDITGDTVSLLRAPEFIYLSQVKAENLAAFDFGPTSPNLCSRTIYAEEVTSTGNVDIIYRATDKIVIKGGGVSNSNDFANMKLQRANFIKVEDFLCKDTTGTRFLTLENADSGNGRAIVRECIADNAQTSIVPDGTYSDSHIYNNSWQTFTP